VRVETPEEIDALVQAQMEQWWAERRARKQIMAAEPANPSNPQEQLQKLREACPEFHDDPRKGN